MTSSRAPTCAACGAPAPAVFVPTHYTCGFCHRQQLLQPLPSPAPPMTPHVPVPPRVLVPPPNLGGGAPTPGPARLLATLVPVIVVAAVGLVIALSSSGKLGGPSKGSGPGSGGVVPPGERLQWVSWGRGNLRVADVNGDGVEDFVGRYKVLDLSTRESTQTEYIGGFDGETFQRIWASPALGTSQQASGAIAFGVAGDRVIVTDYRAQAHILDLRTGKPLRLFALSDRAKSMCSPGERRSEVWIEVADTKNVVFNLETGSATPAARPSWCSPRPATMCDGHAFSDDPCAGSREQQDALRKAGVNPDYVLVDADRAYGVGDKYPGTPVRMITAFDPRTLGVTWQSPVAPDPANAGTLSNEPATLAGGRVYLTYKTTTPPELHVVAFDGASGKRVLDMKVPRGDEGSDCSELIVSANRIYVPHWTWLDVFDTRTAQHLETVGMW